MLETGRCVVRDSGRWDKADTGRGWEIVEGAESPELEGCMVERIRRVTVAFTQPTNHTYNGANTAATKTSTVCRVATCESSRDAVYPESKQN